MLRRFHRVVLAVVVAAAALSATAVSIAATQRSAVSSSGLGHRLVNRFFSELKRHNRAAHGWQLIGHANFNTPA